MAAIEDTQPYLDFVRYCISEQQCIPTIMDWHALFLFMQEQALLGVGFRGIERMKEAGVDIPRNLLLKWYAISEQIRQRNVEMNKRCVELTEMLKKDGFESCILKGQGNAVLYSNPYTRQPGDIDVWVSPISRKGKDKKDVINYVKRKYEKVDVEYHHVEVMTEGEIDVEFHYMPGYIQHPLYNRRLQKFFDDERERQMKHRVLLEDVGKEIVVPTWDFNVIQQLEHMKNHFINEGVGLRQMMDYYYLLRKAKDDNRQRPTDNGELIATLKWLGLYKFAGAVMWVLHEVFGLEEKCYIVPVDERRGKTLLKAVLNGGNFGHHAEFYKRRQASKNHIRRFMIYTTNSFNYFDEYPSDVIFSAIFRFVNYFRTMLNNK